MIDFSFNLIGDHTKLDKNYTSYVHQYNPIERRQPHLDIILDTKLDYYIDDYMFLKGMIYDKMV